MGMTIKTLTSLTCATTGTTVPAGNLGIVEDYEVEDGFVARDYKNRGGSSRKVKPPSKVIIVAWELAVLPNKRGLSHNKLEMDSFVVAEHCSEFASATFSYPVFRIPS